MVSMEGICISIIIKFKCLMPESFHKVIREETGLDFFLGGTIISFCSSILLMFERGTNSDMDSSFRAKFSNSTVGFRQFTSTVSLDGLNRFPSLFFNKHSCHLEGLSSISFGSQGFQHW